MKFAVIQFPGSNCEQDVIEAVTSLGGDATLLWHGDRSVGDVDAVVVPADDGGYALIGLRHAEPAIFSDMRWSTPDVMDETRRRLRRLGLTWEEPATLWDVDVPDDLERLRATGLQDLIPSP